MDVDVTLQDLFSKCNLVLDGFKIHFRYMRCNSMYFHSRKYSLVNIKLSYLSKLLAYLIFNVDYSRIYMGMVTCQKLHLWSKVRKFILYKYSLNISCKRKLKSSSNSQKTLWYWMDINQTYLKLVNY